MLLSVMGALVLPMRRLPHVDQRRGVAGSYALDLLGEHACHVAVQEAENACGTALPLSRPSPHSGAWYLSALVHVEDVGRAADEIPSASGERRLRGFRSPCQGLLITSIAIGAPNVNRAMLGLRVPQPLSRSLAVRVRIDHAAQEARRTAGRHRRQDARRPCRARSDPAWRSPESRRGQRSWARCRPGRWGNRRSRRTPR